MIPMMMNLLLDTPKHEALEDILIIVRNFVTQLTGKQTIYQIIRLCEEMKKRGAKPQDPLFYKQLITNY